MSVTLSILPVALGSLFAFGCLIGAFNALRHKRLIDDMPTSKTQGVFIGLAELKGTAESEGPLTSQLAGIRCVEYSWQVEEHWSRTVTETYRDCQGHTQTRTRTESGWTTVGKGGQSIPFYLKDDTGVIRIVPDGAKVEGETVFNETVTRDNPLYFGKGPQSEIANSNHRRRFHETAIPLHVSLYVVGQARERQDIVAPEIAREKDAPMFLISIRTEKQISSAYNIWYWVWVLLGLVFIAIGITAQNFINRANPATLWQPYLIATLGYLFVAWLGWVWTVYNSLVNLHHRVEQAWSQVDVQLKRRNDLIPNLVQTVEGYRAYEKEVQLLVTELRGQLSATPPGVEGTDFKGLAPVLRIVVERYPELKASESFLKLQQTLIETEQRIALARDYYNEIATFYNNRLTIIPDRFVAVIARLRQRSLLVATDFERAPVQVQLAA